MKFREYINESSLSRIMHHVEETDNFGVISPYRLESSDEENKENYKELAKEIRSLGYGFIAMKGGYVGDEGFIAEKSYFIPNIKRDEIIKLGAKYNQYSVLHKDKNEFAEIGTNKNAGVGKVLSNFVTKGRNINIDDVGDKFKELFSKLTKGSHRGKKFLFKMQEKVETSMYQKMKHGDK